ncbi:DUF1681-domain-containing protein [Aureobasidium subglaciale]|nr:DUF1681-domain-containing protein [Aureobasidium subglaciale]
MTTLDPATGRPLPDSAIQRVLFICPRVHVYQIPPLTSNKGFSAGSWTAPPRPTAQMIFTAQTSLSNQIKTDIVLEDPKTGDLFAACPYTSAAVVEQANDSSRFFAIRVVGEGGMKATLGMGFEERPDAFDFSITLSEARKLLGMEQNAAPGQAQQQQMSRKTVEEPKKDFSLKEGESIHVEIGGRGRRQQQSSSAAKDDGNALFSIAPPPPPASEEDFASLPSLAPPPSAAHVKAASKSPSPARPQDQAQQNQPSAQDLGFDDGEFGEFQ